MSDEIQKIVPEIWQRFFTHIPECDDFTLVVLKGHLLIEEELNRVIENSFEHPEYLEDGRFSFFQTLKIVKAFHFNENRKWVWDAIEKLNGLRNRLSHNLEPKDIENQVEALIELVCCNIGTNDTTFSSKLRHSIAMLLCMINDLRIRGYAI